MNELWKVVIDSGRLVNQGFYSGSIEELDAHDKESVSDSKKRYTRGMLNSSEALEFDSILGENTPKRNGDSKGKEIMKPSPRLGPRNWLLGDDTDNDAPLLENPFDDVAATQHQPVEEPEEDLTSNLLFFAQTDIPSLSSEPLPTQTMPIAMKDLQALFSYEADESDTKNIINQFMSGNSNLSIPAPTQSAPTPDIKFPSNPSSSSASQPKKSIASILAGGNKTKSKPLLPAPRPK